MTDPTPEPEVTPDLDVPHLQVRYVAGLAPSDDGVLIDVVRLVEIAETGERYGSPTFVITGLDADQTRHLRLQLGKALMVAGDPDPEQIDIGSLDPRQAEALWGQLGRALNKPEWPEPPAPDVLAQIDSDNRWKSLRSALDYHREHEGVEVEVSDVSGWRDVRDLLPAAYATGTPGVTEEAPDGH